MSRARLFLATLGFVLAALGVTLDFRPLVWAAIAVLSAALAFRLYLRHRSRQDSPDTN